MILDVNCIRSGCICSVVIWFQRTRECEMAFCWFWLFGKKTSAMCFATEVYSYFGIAKSTALGAAVNIYDEGFASTPAS